MRGVFRSISWRPVVCLAYALALTALLLSIRFPAEKFKQFCENRLERISPGSTCAIERIDYRFPFTVTFYGIRLKKDVGAQSSGLHLDSLSITATAAQPKNLALTASLYGGTLSARLAGDYNGKKISLHAIQLTGLDIAALHKDLAIVNRTLTGTFAFTGSYRGGIDNLAGGTWQGQAVADGGSVALLQPVLSLAQIDYSQVVCNLQYANNKLMISDGKLKGNEVTADFAGELQFAASVYDGELRFSGGLVPQRGYLESHPQEQKMVQGIMKRNNMTALPFRVGGTLNNPTFRFSK